MASMALDYWGLKT